MSKAKNTQSKAKNTQELEMRLQTVLQGQPVESCIAALALLLVIGAKHSGCSLNAVQDAIRYCWDWDRN